MPDGPDGSAEPVTRASVRETYEEIGGHFAKTREYPWPEIETFLERVNRGDGEGPDLALDVGCGNGRHTALLAGVAQQVVGLDPSLRILDAAVARAREEGWAATFAQGDAVRLPLATDSVDLAVYVATLHHVPERAARVASLDELARVLAPGAPALVSAWSTTHDRFEAAPDATVGFDTTVDWTLPGGETVPRYYHIYAPAEFETDIEDSGLALESAFVASGNCYARVSAEQ